MKKLSLLFVAILFAVTGILAQTPNEFKYQAVLRDAGGQIMADEAVTVDISILQGSASGTSVFDETHNVTTTAQGLINLNIGSTEDLSVVDFSDDTYFIEITVNGTVMGTSQLLSVPYALQAKEVENVDYSQITNTPLIPEDIADLTDNNNLLFSGDYNDLTNLPTLFDGDWTSLTNTPTTIAGYGITDAFDGDYNSLSNLPTLFDGDWTSLTNTPTTIAGYGITDAFDGDYNSLSNLPTLFDGDWTSLTNTPTTIAGYGITDAFSGDYNDLINTPTINGSETVINAGTNVTVTGTGTSGDPYVVNATDQSPAHYVGELYGGGIVFYVYDEGQHGLIASLDDLSTGIQWGGYGTDIPNCESGYDGASNTAAIVSQLGNVNTHAAGLCNLYTGGSQSDWYLPASWELNLLYNAAFMISYKLDNDGDGSTNGLTFSASYWSSTENNSIYAWNQNFGNGTQNVYSKGTTYRVRAVRRF